MDTTRILLLRRRYACIFTMASCAARLDVSAVWMYSRNASDFQRPRFLICQSGWLAAARADSPPIRAAWLDNRAGSNFIRSAVSLNA